MSELDGACKCYDEGRLGDYAVIASGFAEALA